MSSSLVVISGPTGSGKSELAMRLCDVFPFMEIVSADSVQVYRYMDIGSGKVSREQLLRYPHHCIDVVDPDCDFDASAYSLYATEVIRKIHERGRLPLVVGGSGMYIDALLFGLSKIPDVPVSVVERLKEVAVKSDGGIPELRFRLEQVDPAAAAKIHPNDLQRTLRALAVFEATGTPISSYQGKKLPNKWNPLIIVTESDRSALYSAINKRVDSMMHDGFMDEVVGLVDRGYSLRVKKTIGYAQLYSVLLNETVLPAAVDSIKQLTRKYAKRQILWFSRYDCCRYGGDFLSLSEQIQKYILAHMPDGGVS